MPRLASKRATPEQRTLSRRTDREARYASKLEVVRAALVDAQELYREGKSARDAVTIAAKAHGAPRVELEAAFMADRPKRTKAQRVGGDGHAS